MATELIIIRHGEAYSNIESVIEGKAACRGLTERGLAQAKALATRLATGKLKADMLYASPILRAKMTAELVAEAMNLPIQWDDELHELRPGDAEGMRFEELRASYPQIERFMTDPFVPFSPNGESWGTFQARVSAALERILNAHPDQRIMVVAHGGVVEIAHLYLLGLGPSMRRQFAFPVRNTAITRWRHDTAANGRAEWRLLVHNDYRHLDD